MGEVVTAGCDAGAWESPKLANRFPTAATGSLNEAINSKTTAPTTDNPASKDRAAPAHKSGTGQTAMGLTATRKRRKSEAVASTSVAHISVTFGEAGADPLLRPSGTS